MTVPPAQPPDQPTAQPAARTPWTASDDAALKHAWDWFSLHAAQRMQLLSFFFVGLALVVAGYGAAFQVGSHMIAGALATAGVLICLGFFFLEERTRQLCRACEPTLAHIQAHLSQANSLQADVTFVPAVEQPIWKTSYSKVIRSLIVGSGILMLVGSLYAFGVVGDVDTSSDTNRCTGTFDTIEQSPSHPGAKEKGTKNKSGVRRAAEQEVTKSEFAVVCTP